MDILYLNNTSIRTPGGGGEDRMDEISSRLVRYGHDVLILAGRSGPELDRWETSEGRRLRHVTCISGFVFRYPTVAYYATRYLFAFASLPVLVWLLWREEFDVVVENMTPYPTFAVLVANGFGVPVVAVQHEFFDRGSYEVYDPVTATIQLIVQNFHRVFPYAALVVPASHVKEQFVEYGVPEERISVIPNGIDVEKYRMEDVDVEEGRLVVLGRLMKRKGQDRVIRATRALVDDGYDVTLDVIGDGPMRSDLEELVLELDMGTSVKFHGFVDEDEKVRLLNRAHVFVFASNQEGFGIALLEAMAAGTPVVAYRLPVYEEFFEDGVNGILVDGRDPSDLATAVKSLLDDPAAVETLRAENVETAKGYTWEAVAGRTDELLRDVGEGSANVAVAAGGAR